ncbi:hypothetical protein DPMN_169322 [Dreissena polymorpha]|uniref:Uncharacterized protein n=1 Tax=Dreissena polymorpha TaxID=45954 RepID=A0A9D4F2E8_DREPO|nr:hypothetical protein DPMN_169322 [Dreissena polymorpha]
MFKTVLHVLPQTKRVANCLFMDVFDMERDYDFCTKNPSTESPAPDFEHEPVWIKYGRTDKDGRTDKGTDTHTPRKTDWQTDRQTDTETDRQRDRHKDSIIRLFYFTSAPQQ